MKKSSLCLTGLQEKLSFRSKVNQSDSSTDSRQVRHGGNSGWDCLAGASLTTANVVEPAQSSVLQSNSSREGSGISRQRVSIRINQQIINAFHCEPIENADLKMRSGRVNMHQVANAILVGARSLIALFVLAILVMPINLSAQTVLWEENWDASWEDRWYVDFGTWEVGMPTSGPDTTHDGDMCAATILAGNYPEAQSTRLIKIAPFEVPSASENPRLRFWHWYSFSTSDYGQVQVRIAGQSNWTALSSGRYGHGSVGYHSSSRWTRPSLDLSAYAGQTIELCFYFYSSCTDEWPNGCVTHVAPGWYIDEILVETGMRIQPDPEDWESGIGDWYTDFGVWEIGTPTVAGPSTAHSGSQCASTILNGNYQEGSPSRLISSPFTVPSASENPRLRFWHWYSFSTSDYGQVQVRIAGQSNWTALSSGRYGHGSVGYHSSSRWTRPSLDLSAYAGQTIELCFYFYSSCTDEWPNGCVTHVAPGWYIDEILVETGIRSFQNPEGWELGIGDWYTDFGVWEIGTPKNVGPVAACQGEKCAATIIDANYQEGTPSRLISPVFRVPDVSFAPVLRYRHWYSFSTSDYGQVQLRVVGESNWRVLANYTGNSGSTCQYPLVDSLEQFAGLDVQLAFYFYSTCTDEWPNGCVTHVSAGWYVDDIKIVLTGPYIYCPTEPVKLSSDGPGQLCFPLQIWNYTEVNVNNGSWSNNQLCFAADTFGVYDFHVTAKNGADSVDCDFTVNVSGVKVGDETVLPGGTVRVPITLFTDQPLSGFTIPLKYSTTQPGNVTLDSVSVVPWVGDSVYIVNDSVFIVHRPVQPIPMPDSTGLMEVGYAYFRISNGAAPEIIPIDTTTGIYNAVTYSYQFITAVGDTIVPLFVPGSVTIEGNPCVCGDFDCNGQIVITDVVYLVNYIFAGGPAPQDVSGGDVDCSGRCDISDVVYLVNYIFISGPAPCANCPYRGGIEKSATGSIELWIEEIDGPTASYVLKVKTDISIAGLQFEMTTDQDPNLEAAAMKEQVSLFSSFTNGKAKVGLVDLTAAAGIPAGEHELLRWEKSSGSEPVLSNALAANRSAEPVDVKILGAKRGAVLPTVFAIDQNYPNPFNPSTEIVYAVPRSEHVRVEVFNVLGQHVATLVNAPHQAGRYSVAWNSRDDNGRDVASGVYLYRMTAGDFVSTRKMMLLK